MFQGQAGQWSWNHGQIDHVSRICQSHVNVHDVGAKCFCCFCLFRMLRDNKLIRHLMSQPLSVYFDAYRTEVRATQKIKKIS
jgi:hypothetical protein